MGVGTSLLYTTNPAADTLFRRITPLPEQLEYLQAKWHELQDKLLRPLSAEFKVPTSTWIQGSYKYQTILRPFAGEEFDLDLGFYFSWSGGERHRPLALKNGVQGRLALLAPAIEDAREVVVPPKERCCRLVYENKFHIDVPVYHLDEPSDERQLARQAGTWEASDPKALYKWFRTKIVRTDRQQVRRLICYLKAWSRLRLSGAARPASILLTVLAVDAAYSATFRTDLADDYALAALLQGIRARLAASPTVPNPVDPDENLNRLSPEGLSAFIRGLDTAIVFARAAATAADLLTAARNFEWLFSYMVPFPDTIGDRKLRESARAISKVEPDVLVRVLSSTEHLIASARNQASGVRKNYILDFQVANANAFPAGSHYLWTVRNVGNEAEEINDLGHTQEGTNRTSVREHARYNGRQFMDLTIRDQGKVVGFRRIPVDISGEPLANPYKKRRYGPN